MIRRIVVHLLRSEDTLPIEGDKDEKTTEYPSHLEDVAGKVKALVSK